MTDFPSSKKTFSQIVDGTDYIEATQLNQAYDEAEAIETLVGALGRSQAYSSSLKSLLTNYIRGCTVEYKSAADLYVRAGEIYIPDASGNGAYRVNTADTTVTWANIDTGAEGNATYYVYAVADSAATTFTVVISLNATTPSGCTYYRRIGSFVNATDITASSVNNDNPVLKARSAISQSVGTTYLAYADGVVTASAISDGGGNGYIRLKTDSANPPTTIVAQGYYNNVVGSTGGSVSCGVKKGEYYLAEVSNGTTIMFFTPMGA